MALDEIVGIVNSDPELPLNDLITDYGNVTNAIKQDTYNLITRGSIKSIQRGIANGKTQSTGSYTVRISEINTNNSFLILYGRSSNSDLISYILNNTSIEVGGVSGDVGITFSWQVIEFY